MRFLLSFPQISPSRLSLILLTIARFTLAAQLTFTIGTSQLLSNPATLPASTRASLFKHGTTITVPITRRNTFEFWNLTQGSYLFTVSARDHNFGPLRVDIIPPSPATISGEVVSAEKSGEKIEVYQTFWGNEWRNKGEFKGGATAQVHDEEAKAVVELVPDRIKEFYAERPGFDPISFLKNPMILMALVSLLLIVGIPYLTDGMDEETRAEFEQLQAKSSLSQAANISQNGFQNVNLAGWLADKTSNAASGESSGGGGAGRKGGDKRKT